MSRENIGYTMILLICCVGPLLWMGIGIAAYKRYLRRGLGGFIPKIRTDGVHR